MRFLKEILVLAIIVVVFAFAARKLEGIDAGQIETDAPPLMESLKQMLGWDDHGRSSATPATSE